VPKNAPPGGDIGGDLAQLLNALRTAPDSWSRLKLVASGAHALAKLTPQQRVQLLRQLGLQGAEELAEAAAGGDAQTATAMTEALRALESDPRRLQQLAGAIADPKSRRTTLMGLGAHVMEAVTAPQAPATKKGGGAGKAGGQTANTPPRAAATPPAPPQVPAPASRSATSPRQAVAEVVEAAAALLTGVQPGAPQPPAPPSQPTPTPATPQPATPPPSLPPTPHPTPSPQPPPAAPQPTPPSAPPAVPPASPPSMPQPVHPVTPPAPSAEIVAEVAPPPAPSPTITEIAPLPAAASSGPRPAALGTLRDLRRRLAGGDTPAADEVATLFAEELPQGWARRRALAALFAQQRPEALDDALALVAQVGSTVDRRWALTDLAASRPWTDGDWERLVATAGGAGERRRLAMRRRRA